MESEFGGIKEPAVLDFLRALNRLSDYKYADGFLISDCVNAYKAAMPVGLLNADGLLRAIIFTSANFIPYGDEVLKLRLLLKNFDKSAY